MIDNHERTKEQKAKTSVIDLFLIISCLTAYQTFSAFPLSPKIDIKFSLLCSNFSGRSRLSPSELNSKTLTWTV